MAALPPSGEINDLQPHSTRDWFIHLNTKIDSIMESQADTDEMLANYMQKTNDWIKCHDESLHTNLRKLERHDEKIDQLEKKVNTWNITNSLGAIIAGILAAIGIKGS